MYQRLKQDQAGFTLIELLMAMMVSGIILSALATGFIATLRGTGGVHERLVQSHDAQLLATYFTSDVQSANPAMVEYSDPATPTGCAGSSPGTNVLRLQWAEVTGGSITAFSASYRMASPATDEWKLYRHFCTGTGTTDAATILATRPVEVSTVAHDLRDPTLQGPVVSQSDAKLTLTLYSALVSGSNPYDFSFTATMRTPATASLAYLVSTASANRTAGVPFDVTVKATTDGTTADTSYSGVKTLAFSGPSNAPSGASPTYPASVTFANGEATFSVTMVRAGSPTLTISQGLYSGSLPLTVAPAVTTLTLGPCPPATKISTATTETVSRGVDSFGNTALTTTALVVNLSASSGSLPSTVTIPAAASSTTFTYTTPAAIGTNVTLTANAAGHNSGSCGPFTTTNTNPVFLVTAPSAATAGTSFDLTVKASSNGTDVDTSYTGAKVLTFTGASNAPNGQAPSFPANVTFTNGEAIVPVTLYKTGGTTLTVADGTRTGTAGAVTVASGPLTLAFTACPPDTAKNKNTNITVSGSDAFGNAPTGNVTVSLSVTPSGTDGGSFSPGSVEITAGSMTSGTSSLKKPKSSGVETVITASAAGHTPGSCTFTTTNN